MGTSELRGGGQYQTQLRHLESNALVSYSVTTVCLYIMLDVPTLDTEDLGHMKSALVFHCVKPGQSL